MRLDVGVGELETSACQLPSLDGAMLSRRQNDSKKHRSQEPIKGA
jgi:hypothetical protein